MIMNKIDSGLCSISAALRRIFSLLLVCVASYPAVSARDQSVGLVLSGGGSKGIAHIGVIQALEDNGIPVDYVTGTSMGAIVGGLYACGYSPAEMLELIESRSFSYWSTGRIDESLVYYFSRPEPTPALYSVNVPSKRDRRGGGSPVPTSLISPLPMNFAFMDLFAPYTAQCGGRFDRLFVPFRCVASDVVGKHKVVLGSGSVGDAIRASMSFPIVFQPTEIDSTMLYDGGIYDNFPVDVMRDEFHPDIVIGIDVSTPDKHPSYDVVSQLETMIIQNNDYTLPAEEGIKIHIDLSRFGLLDFQKAREIYKIGYDRAMEYMDSIRGRVVVRTDSGAVASRRAAFKASTPGLRFDSVSVTGGSKSQNRYISYLFDREQSDAFGVRRARDAYYRAISSDKMRNLLPCASYDSVSGLFDLSLKASVKDDLKVGVGGYITSSTNSMVFLSAGYSTMSFRSVEASVNAWIGQSYMAGMANAGLHLRTGNPSALDLQAVVSRQKFYENDNLFFTKDIPRFVTQTEAFGRLRYMMGAGRNGKVEGGVGIGYLDDRYYDHVFTGTSWLDKDRCSYTLGQVCLKYEFNTLNNRNYPTSGGYIRSDLSAVTGRYRFRSHLVRQGDVADDIHWATLAVAGKKYFAIHPKVALGVESDVVVSTRKLLRDYNAAIVGASAFNPTPSSYNAFNPAFRANSYVTAGVVPVWNVSGLLQLRLSMHAFMPFRRIGIDPSSGYACYGRWFSDPEFFGELAAVYSFPFASLSAYCNYMSYPARNWNVGVSFGIFILAPEFLK